MAAGENAAGVGGPEKSPEQRQNQTKPPRGELLQSLEQPARKKKKQQLQERERQQHHIAPQQHHRKLTQQQQQLHQRIQQQQQLLQQQQRETHSVISDPFAGCQQQLTAAVASLQSGGFRKKRRRKDAPAGALMNPEGQKCRRTQKEEADVVEQCNLQQAERKMGTRPQQLQQRQQPQLEPQQALVHQKPPQLRQPDEALPCSVPSQHHKHHQPLLEQPQPSQQPHKQLQQPVARQRQQQKQQQVKPPKQQQQQSQKQQQQPLEKQHYMQEILSGQHQASQLWQRERASSNLEGAASPRVGSAGIQEQLQPQPPSASHSLFTAHQVKSLQDGLRAFQQEASAAPTLATAAAARGKAAALLLGAAARRLAAVAPRLSACFSRRMAELTQHHGIEVDPKVLQGLCGGCGVPLVPFITSRLRTRSLARRSAVRRMARRIKQQLLQRNAESAKGCLAGGVPEAPQDFAIPSLLETVCKLCGQRPEMTPGPPRIVGGKELHQKQQEQVASRGTAFNKQKLQHFQQRRRLCPVPQQQQRSPTEDQNEKHLSANSTVFRHRETDVLFAERGNRENFSQSGFAGVEESTGHSSSIGSSYYTTEVASVWSVTDPAASFQIEKEAEITRVAQPAQRWGVLREHAVEEVQRDKGAAAHGSIKINEKKVDSVYAILAEFDS
ncbi:hypothetical protein Esti_001914 [Eimeria stiedai]